MGNTGASILKQNLSPLDEKRETIFKEKEEQIIEKILGRCKHKKTHDDSSDDETDEHEQDVDQTDNGDIVAELARYEYPFENVIFEGGGNKGLAYCGAIRCLEDMGILPQIKRFGGSSAGAITAALLAVGYNSTDIEDFMSEGVEQIFLDHAYGYLSLVPNLISGWGWNPGRRIYEWLGEKIKGQTGNADLTFYELYKSRGIELCVVVTNLNHMKSEFCHPKTTPNMSIRQALRMSMSIPVVFMACTRESYCHKDVYVDGGVLCNYPIQCFDGWYLSMDKKDAFLLHMQQMDDLSQMFSVNNRFQYHDDEQKSFNDRSLGFLLYDDLEAEVMKEKLEKRKGALLPRKPRKETKLYKKKLTETKIQNGLRKERGRNQKAAEAFVKALQKYNIEDAIHIDKEELRKAFEDETVFSVKDRKRLFGDNVSVDEAFGYLDRDGNGRIDIVELLRFLETRNVRIQSRIQGYRRTEINSLIEFGSALQNAWATNMKYIYVGRDDYKRTVGINTGHVGTSNYDLEREDRDFIIARGYNATVAFLRYYLENNPGRVEKKPSDGENASTAC